MQQSGPPVELDIERHGDCVQRSWFAINSLGNNPAAFIEVMN